MFSSEPSVEILGEDHGNHAHGAWFDDQDPCARKQETVEVAEAVAQVFLYAAILGAPHTQLRETRRTRPNQQTCESPDADPEHRIRDERSDGSWSGEYARANLEADDNRKAVEECQRSSWDPLRISICDKQSAMLVHIRRVGNGHFL